MVYRQLQGRERKKSLNGMYVQYTHCVCGVWSEYYYVQVVSSVNGVYLYGMLDIGMGGLAQILGNTPCLSLLSPQPNFLDIFTSLL